MDMAVFLLILLIVILGTTIRKRGKVRLIRNIIATIYIRIKQEKKRNSPQSYIDKIIMQAPDVVEWLRFKENMDRKLTDSDNY